MFLKIDNMREHFKISTFDSLHVDEFGWTNFLNEIVVDIKEDESSQ